MTWRAGLTRLVPFRGIVRLYPGSGVVYTYDRRIASLDETGGTWQGWEHRKEKEEAIERNIEAISPHLKSLWRKMKHVFKGTPESRTEQFLQYVHDHPGEDMELLQDEADRDLAKMIKELEGRHWEPHPQSYFPPAPPQWEAEDPIPFAASVRAFAASNNAPIDPDEELERERHDEDLASLYELGKLFKTYKRLVEDLDTNFLTSQERKKLADAQKLIESVLDR